MTETDAFLVAVARIVDIGLCNDRLATQTIASRYIFFQSHQISRQQPVTLSFWCIVSSVGEHKQM